MKKKSDFRIVLSIVLMSSILFSGCSEKTKVVPTQVDLLSSTWSFNTDQAVQSTLTTQNPATEFAVSEDTSFTIKFTVNLKKFDGTKNILEIPEILNVALKQHDTKERKPQNYPAYKMPDGSVPVLEASLALQLPVEDGITKEMPVGIPLAMLEHPEGKHEVILHFSGVRWTMYVDGELLDNDFPLGYPKWKDKSSWKLDPEYVEKAEIYFPGLQPERIAAATPKASPEIQYWTPPGHNTWVGDVATFYHNGRYHIFYLFDRRNHASKFGRGAHYFEHISTSDFKTWTEHEAATPIEKQWETFGTGTPFVFDGKFCVSYGLHTTRIYPREMTTLPQQWDYFNKNGVTGSFLQDTTAGFPAGSTYVVSEDGVSKFKKTGIMFHPCENPSVYVDPNGNLRMLANYGAKGTWESKSINGGWYSISQDFPPGGDCTFFFRWGKYDYIIGGFTGLWSKPAEAPETAYQDIVKDGFDFYNGMCVPAITEIPGGRFLMAGWMQIQGWGGTLNIHELIQYPDGRVGTKWMEEIIPQTENPKTIAKNIKETSTFPAENESFLLTCDVSPVKDKKGKFGITFLPENGEQNACELQIRSGDQVAQYGVGSLNGFAGDEKSLKQGGAPQSGRNYAIENLKGVEEPFKVRLIVKGSEKLGGSQIDTEIAGQRTMISFRPDLKVENILFRTENVEVKNVRIAKLSKQ